MKKVLFILALSLTNCGHTKVYQEQVQECIKLCSDFKGIKHIAVFYFFGFFDDPEATCVCENEAMKHINQVERLK